MSSTPITAVTVTVPATPAHITIQAPASLVETAGLTSANAASASAAQAAASEANAGAAAASAAAGATAAGTGAAQAAAQAASANTSATDAAGSATASAAAAANAAASAASASGSATSAATQAASATTQATNAAASASTATTQAGNAANAAGTAAASATSAVNSATAAANSATALSASSTTPLTVAVGAQTLATQSGKAFVPGMMLLIASAANPANYLHGQVASYSGTSLTVNAFDCGGAGTHGDWNIGISGTQGTAGATGATGPGLPAGGTAGQALTKTDSGNYDAQWTTLTPASVGLGNVANAGQVTTAQMGAASGVATLNAGSLVVQNPASAGQPSGIATLNAGGQVVQNPANLSTDGTFAASSDTLVPSQKAAKAYADGKLAGIAQYSEQVNALGNVTGTAAINLTLGGVVTATATGATAWTVANPAASGKASTFVLIVTNGGAFAQTWPTGTKWPGGTAPTLTSSGTDIMTFLTVNGGANWYATLAQRGCA